MNDRSDQSRWSFDKWSETYDSEIESGSELFKRYDDVLSTVVEVARIGPESHVLDIGVGTGNLALLCLELGAKVHGIDPFKGMLAKAEPKFAKYPKGSLSWKEDPFLSLPCGDASVDAIVSTFAFHHVLPEEKPKAVKELHRVLKPGGVIAIGDFMFENARMEADAIRKFDWLDDDDEYYSRIDELRGMFDACGMELICQQFTPVTWVLHAIKPQDS